MSSRILLTSLSLLAAVSLEAQQFPSADPVLKAMWTEGMDASRLPTLSQALLDSIGPRLTGSPGIKAGNDWLVRTFTSWGIPARNEQYGTWPEWRRGASHIDLVAPRVRSLEGTISAWSPGTGGRDVVGPVVLLPDLADSAAYAAWWPQARGKFVLLSFAEPSCRPDREWAEGAAPGSFERMSTARADGRSSWASRISKTGLALRSGLGAGRVGRALGEAGAVGVIISQWERNEWGTRRVFGDLRQVVPSIDLSCEDYGLLFRLASNNQGPTLRLRADAEMRGEQPVFNTIAELKGTTKPDEYVLLSAHFDSFDAGSGAADNGTGSLMMLEAMRVLKRAYPNPQRTIIAGFWSGEEQGLNGSRAWAEDHPEVLRGLQIVLNNDNGTGRISDISASGMPDAAGSLARWLARVPDELGRGVRLSFPGSPSGGGSDEAAFACHGAPAYYLSSGHWSYSPTWHTDRDTFDKVVVDDLKMNATLVAMLAYLASEDPERVSRERRVFESGQSPAASLGGGGRAGGRGAAPREWPACVPALRSAAGYTR